MFSFQPKSTRHTKQNKTKHQIKKSHTNQQKTSINKKIEMNIDMKKVLALSGRTLKYLLINRYFYIY